MQLLDILRAIHNSPNAAEQSFTASMIQGAERVRVLIDWDRLAMNEEIKKLKNELAERTDAADGWYEKYKSSRAAYADQSEEIRSLQEKLAACDHALAEEMCERQMADARIKDLEQEASASDAHASAMEEATMDVEACAKELERHASDVGDMYDVRQEVLVEAFSVILRKHFRAAPAVYLTDVEAVVKDQFEGPDRYTPKTRAECLERLRRFTKRIDREALIAVISKTCLRSNCEVCPETADAVLSFLGAGASDVVLQSHAVDAGPLAQLQHAELHRLLAPVLDAAAFSPGQETAEKAIERLLSQWRSGLQPIVPFISIDGSFGDITRPDWLDIPFTQPFATPVLMVEGAEHVRAYAVSLERTIESLRQAQASGKPRDPLVGESCQACVLGAGAETLADKVARDIVHVPNNPLCLNDKGALCVDLKLNVPPAPAPQESDVESLARAIQADARRRYPNLPPWEEDGKQSRANWLRDAQVSLDWFLAHRVVELPKHNSTLKAFDYGYSSALEDIKKALDRAGIAHRSAT